MEQLKISEALIHDALSTSVYDLSSALDKVDAIFKNSDFSPLEYCVREMVIRLSWMANCKPRLAKGCKYEQRANNNPPAC